MSSQGGEEEDGRLHEIDGRAMKAFNVDCACPADLLNRLDGHFWILMQMVTCCKSHLRSVVGVSVAVRTSLAKTTRQPLSRRRVVKCLSSFVTFKVVLGHKYKGINGRIPSNGLEQSAYTSQGAHLGWQRCERQQMDHSGSRWLQQNQ